MTINQPEFSLRNVMSEVVELTRLALQQANIDAGQPAGWPHINFQFDIIERVNKTLEAWNKQDADRVKRFPLVWLIHPFTIRRGIPERPDLYGELQNGMLIIATGSKADKSGAARVADNFDLIINPIYRELLNQINIHTVFETQSVEQISHDFTERFYWGENQKSVFDDAVDCSIISNLKLPIYHNYNCQPFKNFR